jgi:hypothetical protein
MPEATAYLCPPGLVLAAVIGMQVLQRGKMEGIMRCDGSMSSIALLEGR